MRLFLLGLFFPFFPSPLFLEFFPIDILRWVAIAGGRLPVPFLEFLLQGGEKEGEEGEEGEIPRYPGAGKG